MSKYPQIHVQQKYQDFLKQLAQVGKPDIVDAAYIKKLGFKSSYDKNFLSAIKFIGLVEDKRNGSPTEAWTSLRSDFGGTLAKCLKSGYADLFSFYPDAELRDEEALMNYFRGNTDEDADGVARVVNAFLAVRDLSDFGDTEDTSEVESKKDDNKTIDRKVKVETFNGSQANLNINIQLQLPPDTTGEIYDRFFEAMKKHGLI